MRSLPGSHYMGKQREHEKLELAVIIWENRGDMRSLPGCHYMGKQR